MKRLFGLWAVVCASCAGASDVERVATTAAELETVTTFGSNPGHLTMMRYAPAGMPKNAPLVVALHGCTQMASDFAAAGWNQMADEYKFYVVYPQQATSNNPVSCFDWFGTYNNPADKTNITRGQGENMSIKQMVDKMKADYPIDPQRVYVAGFSSGAAMAAVMLAAWPDVFAAGGIGAGVPYNCPSTQNSDVWTCMNPGKVLQPADWGQRARAAFVGYGGPYPRVTIWQGTQDTTVGTGNQTELVKQWTNVHALSATPTATDMIDGFPRQVFKDGSGVVEVESWAITGMGHGFAIDTTRGCGTAGQYSIDKHVCTARHMAEFFGLTSAASPGSDAGVADGGGSRGGGSGGSGGDGSGGGATPGVDGGVAQGGDGTWGVAHASRCGVARGRAVGSGWLLALFAALALALRRRAS